VSKYTALVVQY